MSPRGIFYYEEKLYIVLLERNVVSENKLSGETENILSYNLLDISSFEEEGQSDV